MSAAVVEIDIVAYSLPGINASIKWWCYGFHFSHDGPTSCGPFRIRLVIEQPMDHLGPLGYIGESQEEPCLYITGTLVSPVLNSTDIRTHSIVFSTRWPARPLKRAANYLPSICQLDRNFAKCFSMLFVSSSSSLSHSKQYLTSLAYWLTGAP